MTFEQVIDANEIIWQEVENTARAQDAAAAKRDAR